MLGLSNESWIIAIRLSDHYSNSSEAKQFIRCLPNSVNSAIIWIEWPDELIDC